jgi:hypothetical protein
VNLNFTWEILDVIKDNKTIELKLDYKNPLYISPGMIPDELVVHMINPALFYSKDLRKYVKEDYRTMKQPLRKQYLRNALNNSLVSGSEIANAAMMWVFVAAIILNFMLKGAMIYWMTLVRAL